MKRRRWLALLMLLAALPAHAWWRKTPTTYQSAEETLQQVTTLDAWQQALNRRETALNDYETAVARQTQQARQREIALNQELQRQRQTAAAQEQTYRRQLETQRESFAYNRLRDGMRWTDALMALGRQQALRERPQRDMLTPPPMPSRSAPALPATSFTPAANTDRQVLIVQEPLPLPTVMPQRSQIRAVINGVNRIETGVRLPGQLTAEQLQAVSKIAENGTVITQQRFALEQHGIAAKAAVERWRIWRHLALWGLFLAIPLLLTGWWMAHQTLTEWWNQRNRQAAARCRDLARMEQHFARLIRQGKLDNEN